MFNLQQNPGTKVSADTEVMMRSKLSTHIQKPPDFISRNRRAVRDAGRHAVRESRQRDAGRHGERGRTGPGTRQRATALELKKGSSDTVEISKSYLERLLQMTMSPQPVVPQSMAPQSSTAAHGDTTKIPTQSSITSALHIQLPPDHRHIQPDRTQVPGLACGNCETHYHHQQQQQQQPGLSYQQQQQQQQQMLSYQQQQQQQQVRQRKEEQEEGYFPWGRPGGGAPLRSVSGSLLTNYSTRGRAVEEMRNGPHTLQKPSLVSSEICREPKNMMSSYKSPFVRGVGPHVDTFVLSQREEQRRKDLIHKEELAVQIAERQRQREAEQHRREREERETEEKVRRELEETNMRSERERQKRQRKAEEERAWQAVLQARVQEAEAAALREKEERRFMDTGKGDCNREPVRGPDEQHRDRATRRPLLPSRIPLASSRKPPRRDPHQPASQRPRVAYPSHTATTRPTAALQPPTQSHPPYHPPPPPPLSRSPVVPALAKKLTQRTQPTQPTQPHTQPHKHPRSPIVPALAKKLATKEPAQFPATQPPTAILTQLPARTLSPVVPALARKLAQQTATAHTTALAQTSTSPSLPLIPHTTKLNTNTCTSSPIPIHRPPSCQPSTHSPPAPPPTLPTLTPSLQHTGKRFPTQAPHSVARQQTILHQLAILREGIESQRKSLDNRLQYSSSANAMT